MTLQSFTGYPLPRVPMTDRTQGASHRLPDLLALASRRARGTDRPGRLPVGGVLTTRVVFKRSMAIILGLAIGVGYRASSFCSADSNLEAR